ncbi:hypothetical protein M407DRAFT_200283 [Tulasnella calospora MUT 4182]|uniref:Uncharacterized protein n=1 Tax=Tulasnella calospora MUT 4182 TaxID=1051891 RepID=A0A0C3QJY9_9AGAM|nr:hypothetical protein M407DRAFT_200283 [Tulasnella calospora MUT 4182]
MQDARCVTDTMRDWWIACTVVYSRVYRKVYKRGERVRGGGRKVFASTDTKQGKTKKVKVESVRKRTGIPE